MEAIEDLDLDTFDKFFYLLISIGLVFCVAGLYDILAGTEILPVVVYILVVVSLVGAILISSFGI